MNAARDTPALFMSSKLASARLAPVGRNFTTSYELQDAAHPHRLDLKFKAEF
ncbi:hypothetical protein [uncultured Campylobacter sp.]|uniref:hypothetical protein n=1 Tax=uncultured Campylobacter sp. TaxID=218934 RepID=UPI00260A7C95|nr:hypothetical protein [uncultured Campylobacter sp.]